MIDKVDVITIINQGGAVREIKNRVYIAGPMTGYPNFNFKAFDKAAEHLKKLDIACVNPALLGKAALTLLEQKGFNDIKAANKWAMEENERLLRTHCHAILLLEGWELSKGAKQELSYALSRDYEIILEKELRDGTIRKAK